MNSPIPENETRGEWIEFAKFGYSFRFKRTGHAQAIINEIFGDNYHVLENVEKGVIRFEAGDIILDLGANEGMFSIMMAKLFPEVHVYSFEAFYDTYLTLQDNIDLNNVRGNVTAYAMGVGGRVELLPMVANTQLSGGSSFIETVIDDLEFWKTHRVVNVPMTTLDKVVEILWMKMKMIPRRVKLLKFDVEGSEYDIFYNTRVLPMVDFAVGEIHINKKLMAQGRSIRDLVAFMGWQTRLLHWEECYMAE
jgi:FkbM family methyltransferase